jgi:hypothetical protein
MKRQQQQGASKPKRKRDKVWEKIKGTTGLYRYKSSRTFFANVRKSGKLHTESLRTKDLATAKRLLRDFKARLDQASGGSFGHIRICVCPGDGSHTFVCAGGSPDATAMQRVNSRGTAMRVIGLTRIRLQLAIYFVLHRGSLPENTARWQARSHSNNQAGRAASPTS